MSCLSEELLYTTVRLEGQTLKGLTVGTGFFFQHKHKLFLVTNKHIVEGVSQGKFIVFEGKKGNNDWNLDPQNRLEVRFSEKNFVGHPDPKIDIAIADVSYGIDELIRKGYKPFWKNVVVENIPSKEEIQKFISPLEEIIFIGYPNGIWDSVNGLPVIRRGITATPYYIDFMDEKRFLVDASVFPGSSGSPVFIYHSGSYSDRQGNLYEGNRFFFLGVIAKVYHKKERGSIEVQDIPTKKTSVPISTQMIDLGIVFKAETVLETIEYYLNQVL